MNQSRLLVLALSVSACGGVLQINPPSTDTTPVQRLADYRRLQSSTRLHGEHIGIDENASRIVLGGGAVVADPRSLAPLLPPNSMTAPMAERYVYHDKWAKFFLASHLIAGVGTSTVTLGGSAYTEEIGQRLNICQRIGQEPAPCEETDASLAGARP